jgi:hypothetical protein
LEHVGQFVIQCGEVSSSDIYKLRLFPLSLSGAAFTWFISLPSNSIYNWSDLEKKKFMIISLPMKLNWSCPIIRRLNKTLIKWFLSTLEGSNTLETNVMV